MSDDAARRRDDAPGERPDDDATHARHEAGHPEWARFRRPGPAPGPAAEPHVAAQIGPDPKSPPPSAPEPPAQPPTAPVASTLLDQPTAWQPPTPFDTDLEARIRADLRRGRTIVWLTWGAALASLALGLVAIRQATLLVAIDRTITTTEEVEAAGSSFDLARAILVVVVLAIVVLMARWVRLALPTFDRLNALGFVDGPRPPAGPFGRLRLLWRPAGVPADRVGWADLRVGGGRRLVLAAAGAVAVAALLGLATALWLGAARDAEMSRALRAASGVDGALWLLAAVLCGSAADAILWREAAAARALGAFIPLVDAPTRPILRLIPPALLFVAGMLVAVQRPDPWFVDCPSGSLSCDGMLVPAERDGSSKATIWIVYAVHHAAEQPLGTLAIAVGGPGASGLESAGLIVESLDPELVRRYDLLFFDQRGVGGSEPRDCPHAGSAYVGGATTESTARQFVQACIAEAHVDPATLDRYATREAADDLDSIRDHLGIERFALYGESYGTELAQAYAARHPDRLTALILDGPVDLTRTANQFWSDAAHAFDRVLRDTLDACASAPSCASDVAEPPGTAYDDLLRLTRNGLAPDFADPDGEIRSHRFDTAALESAVDALLYEPSGRMLLQRAVAAAAHGDPVPAARLADAVNGGEATGVSSFAYAAITCADYRVSPTANPGDVAAVEKAARDAGVRQLRTDEVYDDQLPCLFWPYQPADGTRPAPLMDTPYPVFVLGATDDPITPIAGAEAIAGRLTDGYLIRSHGGPHVTFGRGTACVDGPVLGYLLGGRRPAQRTLDCEDQVAAAYVPLTPTRASDYADALEAMTAVHDELFAEPAYVLWDGQRDLQFGCRAGGYVHVTHDTFQDSFTFVNCGFVPDLRLTGTGSYQYRSGNVEWSLKADDVDLRYESTSAGRHVSGTWKGSPVDRSR